MREGTEDYSKVSFLISQQKRHDHSLDPSHSDSSNDGSQNMF